MITKKYGPVSWDAVTKTQNTDNIAHLPECKGLFLRGDIFRRYSGEPLHGDTVVLAFSDEQPDIWTTTSDSTGKFTFLVDEPFGQKNITILPLKGQDVSLINIHPAFYQDYSKKQNKPFFLTKTEEKVINQKIVTREVGMAYQDDKTQQLTTKQLSREPFYGKPDNILAFDDYIKLPNMEEYFTEVFDHVVVRKKNKKMVINVVNQQTNEIIGPNPCFFINGIPIWSHKKILEMNPRQIENIKVVASRYYIKGLVMDGIIDIKINDDYFKEMSFPLSYTRQPYLFYAKTDTFTPIIHNTNDTITNRMPDYRNLLHWEPVINTDANGIAKISFYTGDKSIDYHIVIQGISGTISGYGHAVLRVRN